MPELKIPPESLSALKNFNFLPNEARVRLPVVCALFSRSASSIWRDIKAGRLPAPIKIGPRATAWVVGDLRKALARAEG